VKVTVTFVLFHPAEFGLGDTEAVIVGGPGEVTVTPVADVYPVAAAVIVAVPAPTPVATPVALTVDTLVLEEAHVTEPVMFWVLPSEYVPVTVNCCIAPGGRKMFCGVMAVLSNVGAVTVSGADALRFAFIAVMIVLPALRLVVQPALPTVATAVLREVHAATDEISALLPSL
jgi:hypothetical protein